MLAKLVLTLSLVGMISCEEPKEAPLVKLPLVIDHSSLPVFTSDLGYEIELTSVRMAVQDFSFTTSGQLHTTYIWPTISKYLIPSANAHPGHDQGGEITGELLGDFILEWPPNETKKLGIATLIAGSYRATNFTFGFGSDNLLTPDDPLVAHTAVLLGMASKGERIISFMIMIDAPENRKLMGVPFDAMIEADTKGELRLRFNAVDPAEGDTIFDKIDFVDLDEDEDDMIVIAPNLDEVDEAYHTLRRDFLTHDHYSVEFTEIKP